MPATRPPQRASIPPAALRRGGGRSKTRRCSSGGSPPWSGNTQSRCSSSRPNSAVASSASRTSDISFVPGRNTKTAPPRFRSRRLLAGCGAPPTRCNASSIPSHDLYHTSRSQMRPTLMAEGSERARALQTAPPTPPAWGNRRVHSASVGGAGGTSSPSASCSSLACRRFCAAFEPSAQSASARKT
eukprot:916288-Prymnesium_polylepis.2